MKIQIKSKVVRAGERACACVCARDDLCMCYTTYSYGEHGAKIMLSVPFFNIVVRTFEATRNSKHTQIFVVAVIERNDYVFPNVSQKKAKTNLLHTYS